MGNMRPIDSAVVKNETYDVLSADTMGGEYIETIGAACQNPDGYTSGSLFLGKDNDVQHLYRATAAIAFGETIILDTNCVYTTVSGELEGKAEESEVTSLNEALTNIDSVISANGAKNLILNSANTKSINGVTFTVDPITGIITTTGTQGTASSGYTLFEVSKFVLSAGRYKLSGCPIGGKSGSNGYSVLLAHDTAANLFEFGDGLVFDAVGSGSYYIYLYIGNTSSFNNKVFKPMLTLADQPNSDYEHYVPYAKTNRELTEEHLVLSTLSQSIGSNWTSTNGTISQKNIILVKHSNETDDVEMPLLDLRLSNVDAGVNPTITFTCDKLTKFPRFTVSIPSGVRRATSGVASDSVPTDGGYIFHENGSNTAAINLYDYITSKPGGYLHIGK